jgi:hypothetical protein
MWLVWLLDVLFQSPSATARVMRPARTVADRAPAPAVASPFETFSQGLLSRT